MRSLPCSNPKNWLPFRRQWGVNWPTLHRVTLLMTLLQKTLVGTTLRRLRLERHLTQDAVAAKAMVSPRYVGQIEVGSCTCSLKTLFRIADGLDMTPSEVVAEVEMDLIAAQHPRPPTSGRAPDILEYMPSNHQFRHIQFGMQLRAWRTAADMTARELADQAGITTGFISHLETGRTLPGKRTCRAMALALGVSELEMLAAVGHVSDYQQSDSQYLEPAERLFFRNTWKQLSEDERSLLRDAMRMLRNRVKARNGNRRDSDQSEVAGGDEPLPVTAKEQRQQVASA